MEIKADEFNGLIISTVIEKDNTDKELKSEQQLLRKALEANQKKPTESSVTYLDWRQLMIIITTTALAASLFCKLY